MTDMTAYSREDGKHPDTLPPRRSPSAAMFRTLHPRLLCKTSQLKTNKHRHSRANIFTCIYIRAGHALMPHRRYNMRTDPPRLETEENWKSIESRPQQHPSTRSSNPHNGRHPRQGLWTAPGPDMIRAYWLKKLTSLHEHLVVDGTQPEWLIARQS